LYILLQFVFVLKSIGLSQACQTQSTLLAAKVTKSAIGAAKVMKNSSVGWPHLGKFRG